MNGSRRTSGESGQALIELAVAAPVLLLLVFGILQFGIVMNSYISVNDAIHIGARALSVTRGIADPCTTAATKTRTAASGLNVASLQLQMIVHGNTYGYAQIPACNGAGVTMLTGEDATLRGTYPCSAIIYGIDFIPGCTLAAQTTVRVE